MAAAVIPLREAAPSYEDALDSYRCGYLSDCASRLRSDRSIPANVLRARVALRLGRFDDGTTLLDGFVDVERSICEQVEYFVVRANLATAASEFDAAREALLSARAYAFGSASVDAESEYYLAESNFAFAIGDLAAASAYAHRALTVEPVRFSRSGYTVPAAHSRARAKHNLGLVEAAEGRYEAQATWVHAALAELDGCPVDDRWLRASLFMHVAFNVRDFDARDDASALRRLATHDWAPELAPMAFEIHRALGWNAALRGDQLGAFRSFRAMAERATSPARRILASVEKSFLARELGEAHSAREEIEYAVDLASRVDWARVGEERIALAQLAQEVSEFAPSVASSLYERYRSLRGTLSPTCSNAIDRRAYAFECMAEGSVLLAGGSPVLARRRLVEAFDIWSSIGHGWRAASAAVVLAEMGAGAAYEAYARREATSRPGSWLARRVAALESQVVSQARG